jgi:ribose transport system ATP-binding protein
MTLTPMHGTPPFQGPALERSGLHLSNVSKTFGANRVLTAVGLDIGVGEIHSLVGHNGSGKSTLVKILSGYHSPDPGAAGHMDGRQFRLGDAQDARRVGLRFVHQNLGGLVDDMTVADNFAMTQAVPGFQKLDRRAEQKAAARTLAHLGSDVSPTAVVGSLAQADRTLVAIARAIAGVEGHAVVVLDEPTASLTGAEVQRLTVALRRLVTSGTSILFISHHLDEVLDLSDRVTVLRDGVRVVTERAAKLSHEGLVESMLGRRIQGSVRNARSDSTGAVVLSARGLIGESVNGIDLTVRAGEVVGIAGLTGSGREEIGHMLSGRVPREGELVVDEQVVRPNSVHAAVAAGLCFAPADRQKHALLNGTSVRENLTIGDLAPFWRRGLFRHRVERRETATWIDRLDVRPPRGEAIINELSGGNQQKIAIARWLRVQLKVLVVDEPTQGVDIGARLAIHRLLQEAAANGAAVIVCSTDSEELEAIAQKVAVLVKGAVVSVLEGDEVARDRIDESLLARA